MGETRAMSRLENSCSRFQKEKKDSELFSLASMFPINLGISLVRGSSKFILSVTFRSFPGTKENIPRIHVIIGKVENRKLRVDWRIANSVVFPGPGPECVQQSCTLTAVSRASNLLQPTYTDPRPRDPHHHSPRVWQSESLSSQGGFVSPLGQGWLSFSQLELEESISIAAAFLHLQRVTSLRSSSQCRLASPRHKSDCPLLREIYLLISAASGWVCDRVNLGT